MLMSLSSAVFAQVPTVMVYQVQVKHGYAFPQDVTIEMQLRKSQNGEAIWNQVFNLTEVKDWSVVNLALDLGDKFDWNDGEYWLATIIDGEEMGSAQLTSVPYAFMAKRVETSKYIEGALTAEELVGKWVYKEFEYEFKSDGTFTFTEENKKTRIGKWKLNGAGILYFDCYSYYENGEITLFDMDVVPTYLDRETGCLKISGGDNDIFHNVKVLTKEGK